MIVDLPDTTVSKISRALIDVREEGGAVALGRVLTLIIVTTGPLLLLLNQTDCSPC